MDFEVRKDDLHETRVVDAPGAEAGDGQARLAVRRFGLSANNITYAVFGDMMGYWSFFPTEEGWGRIPVWGFAEVVEANGTGLEEGDRFYGYLPMGDELLVAPERLGDHGFTDGSPHRAGLPPAYNGYTRCATDPVYTTETEALQMLLRPLFMTDFLLDDWLADSDFGGAGATGAGAVVLSSASSKTAFGLAHLLAARSDRPQVVGLTSASNVDFVRGLGVYDRVLTYGDLEGLDPDAPTTYVDMAGDTGVRQAVHERVRGLVSSVTVGGTHWQGRRPGGDLPGPRRPSSSPPTRSSSVGPTGARVGSRPASPPHGRRSCPSSRTGSRSSSGTGPTASSRRTGRCWTVTPTRAMRSCSASADATGAGTTPAERAPHQHPDARSSLMQTEHDRTATGGDP
jgi:hypothetical protein